jgi:tetratricopeptide (TPR) repeat protein
MDRSNLHLLSTYLKKWSYQDNRFSLSFSYFTEKGYSRDIIDMRISSPQNMVNEFLNRVMYKAKDRISNQKKESADLLLQLVNESEVQRKLNVFVGKILKEFNTNKRSRGRIRMISNRSMDFYYNDFEYEPLDDQTKFYVHLNRGVNKMNGDLWSAAIEDLKTALTFNPDHPFANKYLAEALLKAHRIEEAIQYFEKYAENEDSLQGLNDLAHAYVKLERYSEAARVFKKMKQNAPEDLLAQIGQAQIAYLQGKDFLSLLEKIYKSEKSWLREYLKKSWEYNLPGFGEDESVMWNAATASRYLGYDRPFDLTKRAFNDDLPCYFDSEKGTIRFVKQELDNWVEMMNRFDIDGHKYQVFKDRLSKDELAIGKLKSTVKKKKNNSKNPVTSAS